MLLFVLQFVIAYFTYILKIIFRLKKIKLEKAVRNMKKIFLLAGLLIATFYAGMKVQAFIYEDTCLDLGGGKNPGNYSICVIEKDANAAATQ